MNRTDRGLCPLGDDMLLAAERATKVCMEKNKARKVAGNAGPAHLRGMRGGLREEVIFCKDLSR